MTSRVTDTDGARSAEPIDLAREAPFSLAQLTVVPAALSVRAGDWSRRLEPRAMQVLVLLARSSSTVVGRGELNARVWSGRVVGEDAINRAVQTLRRVAADAPSPPPYTIQTIPRVGYRLMAGEPEAPFVTRAEPAIETRGGERDRRHGWREIFLASAALAILGLFVVWRLNGAHESSPAAWRLASSTTIDDLPPDARDVVLSPDGGRLAYGGRDLRGRERIFVRALKGGGAGDPVSPPDVDVRRPSWSPNSADLAFTTYDAGRPCRLYVLHLGQAAYSPGSCETARNPRLAWDAGGGSLLFADASGWNAVPRITSVRLADGRRSVLSNPPGDSMGDDLSIPFGDELVFKRQFHHADEGWIARNIKTGRERLLWHRRGVTGTVAAALPGGALLVAWTKAGASRLDFIEAGGSASQPMSVGSVTAISGADLRLLVEADRSETALVRADSSTAVAAPLASVRGHISGPALLRGDRYRFPVVSDGVARIWERDATGSHPWGAFTAARIMGLASSPDGRLTAALVTRDAGREIVLFGPQGRPIYNWNPHARSLNQAAWSDDGRHLIAPVLDDAGWRLFALDPFGHAPPRDLGADGFAIVQTHDRALYAVRAGETTGTRELWRLDGRVRRLPIDLTVFDVVNWYPVDEGVWLPDRQDRDRPRLVLRDPGTGRVLRAVDAPSLAGPSSGLIADSRGPIYVKMTRDAPEYTLLTLTRMTGSGR